MRRERCEWFWCLDVQRIQAHGRRIVRTAVEVRKRDMKRLVLLVRRGKRLREVVNEKHENKAQNERDADMAVRSFEVCVYFGRVLLALFRPVYARVTLPVALGRIVVIAFLGSLGMVLLLGFLFVLLALLVAVHCRRVRRSLDDDVCGVGGLAHACFGEIGHAQRLRSDVVRDEVGRGDGPLLLVVRDLGLRMRHVVGVACDGSAVHGLNTLRYNDDERCAHENTGAEQRHGAELARRELEGEREDAGEERATRSARTQMRKGLATLTQFP